MAVLKDNKPNENRYQRGEEDAASSPTDSYEAARADKKEQEKEATKKGAKTAAKAAGTYFGGAAGGKAVDAISKTKVGDKVLNKGAEALNRVPGMGKAMKKLDDKKVLDAADKAVDMAAANPQGGTTPDNISGDKALNGANSGANSGSGSVADSSGSPLPSKPKFLDNDKDKDDGDKSSNFFGSASGNILVKIAIMAVLPFFGIVIFFFMIIASVNGGGIASYEDAFGVSASTGGDTGGVDYSSANPEAKAFYDRVNSVKQQYQAMGKSVNALYISGVYNQLRIHAGFSYKDMTTQVIQTIADAMFQGNSFSKDTFRQNLTSSIFPTYVPGKTANAYSNMADAVFSYVDEYLSLIGQDVSCAAVGSCIYDIKGFFIQGKGNVAKELNISNLQVRLMQSGVGDGHDYGGTWGQPLEGEELVPFEKYVMGVAYQEIGPDAPDEAIKAQLVAARSYILARHVDMGGWRKLEQEDGKWVIQVAASTQDQVYCDPDRGCSANSGGGQWGMVYSGTDHPVQIKPILPEDHKLRTLAAEVQGEVLVNEQGYIIYAGYVGTEQRTFSRLANEGLNYKQILMQVYNSGSRSYGASDLQKANCNNGSGGVCGSTVTASGPYAGWKQADPTWGSITIGSSYNTIAGVGCLVTSVSMLIAKSGVPTTVEGDFNPGTFVKKLNATGGFDGANLIWAAVSNAAPSFVFQTKVGLAGQSREQKLNTIKSLVDAGNYVVVEVKGNTGQHWVAVDSVNGSTVSMMDPASDSTDMWSQYDWSNTSELAYFKVVS